MEISHNKIEKAHIIELVGRLDAVNNAKTEEFFNELTQSSELDVIVDCEKLDFINSSGLRILIMSLKKLKALNKSLLLCNLQKNIKDVFKFSGFTNLFDIEMNREEAIQKIG